MPTALLEPSPDTVHWGFFDGTLKPRLTVNSGDGNLVEITPFGKQVAIRQLDNSGSPPGAGALFGLAVKPGARAVYFVDDATNTLNLLHR